MEPIVSNKHPLKEQHGAGITAIFGDSITHLQLAAIKQIETGFSLYERLAIANPETIHELRVVTKRLRAYWQVLKPGLVDTEVFDTHKNLLSNTAKLFTQSRENHVNRKLISNFAVKFGHKIKKKTLNRLLKLTPALDLPGSGQNSEIKDTFIRELEFWKQLNPTCLKKDYEIHIGVDIVHEKSRQLASNAIDNNLDPILVHKWRKWEKHHLYLIELSNEPVLFKQQKEHVKQLKKLTDILGKTHDLHVLFNLINGYMQRGQLKDEKGELLQLINKQSKLISERLLKQYRQLQAFERRLS